jgi:hypothetical protein
MQRLLEFAQCVLTTKETSQGRDNMLETESVIGSGALPQKSIDLAGFQSLDRTSVLIELQKSQKEAQTNLMHFDG